MFPYGNIGHTSSYALRKKYTNLIVLAFTVKKTVELVKEEVILLK